VRRCLGSNRGFALLTRLEPAAALKLRKALTGFELEYNERAKVLAAHAAEYRASKGARCAGLLTAGTSDIPVAEEAALVMTHMGCRVERGTTSGSPDCTGCWSPSPVSSRTAPTCS